MKQILSFPRYVLACALLWLLGTIYFFSNAGHVELHVSLETGSTDLVQTYYSFNGQWNENDSIKAALAAGANDVVVPLPGLFTGPAVRFDPGQKPGSFRLSDAYWIVGTTRVPLDYTSIVNTNPLASTATASNTDLRLEARDNDPQLIVQTPPLMARMGNVALPLAFSVIALIVLVAANRRVSLPVIAAGVVACCGALFFYMSASIGPRLPLYDDWRYVLPGNFKLTGGWAWLGVVGNDTYFLTNQLLDFVVLRLTNIDFYALRLVAVAVLMLQIALQIRILLRTAQGRPFVGAIAIAAASASLAAGGYWSGDAAIAYQQALPTLFGTLLLGFFLRPADTKMRAFAIGAILVCSLASGLSYISGGVMLASLGAAAFVVYRRQSPSLTRAGLLVFGMGVILFAVQFALVTLHQGSLMEHSHRAETVFPTDRRFWIFFVALFGRALGYRGVFIPIDVLCAALVLAPGIVIGWRELRGAATDSDSPRPWSLLALYAALGAGTYAAIVAFGRAGFAPDTSAASMITSIGKGRFHFWPIATMIPYAWLGWMACLRRMSRYASLAAAAVVAFALVAPKSMATFDNASRLREIAAVEKSGARCVVAHLDDIEAGRPVVCKTLTSLPIDLTPTLRMLRDRHAAMYGQLLSEGVAADNAVRP
jgi:hypothetical protein